ncbi:MAG: glycosyltransferase family 4 protein [Lautropia sp.]|nr:glycosyltransferase family 4 protein [Lautropia sp.]
MAESLVEFRADLIRDLVAKGFEVTGAAAAPLTPEILDEIKALGADFVPLPLYRTAVNPVKDTVTMLAIARLLRRLRPDVLICYTIKPVIYGGLAVRLSGVKLRFVPMITGLGFAFHGGSRLRDALTGVASTLYRQAMVPVSTVIFQNPDDRALFLEKGFVAAEKTKIVNGSGVNLEQYARVPLPPGPQVTFLLAARLLKAKGVREYVAAAELVKKKHPNAHFIIIGRKETSPDAIPSDMIEQWADSDVIEYGGGVKDVRPFVARASVCVLPSYSEGLPRTILEALAMARPVIVTDVPGCRETVVPDVNGCLVPARDVQALAKAMERYLEEPSLIERHGEASYQMALDKFDVRKVNIDILKEVE